MLRIRFTQMVKRNLWRLLAIVERLWVGGRAYGYLRLLFVGVMLGLLWAISRAIYITPQMAPFSFWSARSLRLWVFPLAAFLGAVFLAADYVREIYELPNLRLGIRYLIPAAFGIFHPRLAVKQGIKDVGEDETNLLDTIGGPGYLNIDQGSIALLERLTAPSNVYAAGVHYITRLERVREVFSLEDQHGIIAEMKATTKDGVEIVMRDVNYRYRLRTGRKAGDYTRRTPEAPYPFSMGAIRNLMYSRTVSLDSTRQTRLTPWSDAVVILVEGVITDHIRSHQIDWLTAPREADDRNPRIEIMKAFESDATRERFRSLGTELLWVDIGHFDIVTKTVSEQRVETWQARWAGSAEVTRSYGEAQRIVYQELGRSEAQAELLIGIVEGLKQLQGGGQEMRNLFIMRIAQILEAWSGHDQAPAQQPPPPAQQLPPPANQPGR